MGVIVGTLVAGGVVWLLDNIGFFDKASDFINRFIQEIFGIGIDYSWKGIVSVAVFGFVFIPFMFLHYSSSLLQMIDSVIVMDGIAVLAYFLIPSFKKKGKLEINEINPTPAEGDYKWIEIYNTMESSYSMSNVDIKIDDGILIDIPFENSNPTIESEGLFILNFDPELNEAEINGAGIVLPADFSENSLIGIYVEDTLIDDVNLNDVSGETSSDPDTSYSAIPDGSNNFEVKDASPGEFNQKNNGGKDPTPVRFPFIRSVFQWIFERFPNAFPLLQKILGFSSI